MGWWIGFWLGCSPNKDDGGLDGRSLESIKGKGAPPPMYDPICPSTPSNAPFLVLREWPRELSIRVPYTHAYIRTIYMIEYTHTYIYIYIPTRTLGLAGVAVQVDLHLVRAAPRLRLLLLVVRHALLDAQEEVHRDEAQAGGLFLY